MLKHFIALIPGQRSAQRCREPRVFGNQRIGDGMRRMVVRKPHQLGDSGLAFDECRDGRALPSANDQVSLRKTVVGPGEPGVAEVALRLCRLLGMFARLSRVPWLLIEICARSLGYGCVSGVFHGPLLATGTNGWRSVVAQRDIAWIGIDVGKTHHWACMVDAEGKKLSSIKVANDEAEIVALITNAGSQARQVVWAVDIIGAPSALLLALLARA